MRIAAVSVVAPLAVLAVSLTSLPAAQAKPVEPVSSSAKTGSTVFRAAQPAAPQATPTATAESSAHATPKAKTRVTTTPRATSVRFRVITANIQNVPNLSPAQVARDVSTVRRLAKPLPSVITWQEIAERRDVSQVSRGMGRRYHLHETSSDAVPISTPTEWKQLRSRQILGSPKVPGVSPKRPITSTVQRVPGIETPIAFINVHYTNKGWSKGYVSNRGTRQSLWYRYNAAVRNEIRRYRQQGYPVVISGDFNRVREFPRAHRKLRWMYAGHNDRIGVVDSRSVTFTRINKGWRNLASDHATKWATIKVSERRVRTRLAD